MAIKGSIAGPVVGIVGPGPGSEDSQLIVGITTIVGGTNSYILYDNNGVLGELDTSTFVRTNITSTILIGYTVTPNNLGIITTGTVIPNPALGNYQYYTNNGAHTLAAPIADCAIDLLITNGASAGAITYSGFTVGPNTGFPLTTAVGNKFLISIRRINAVSIYSVYALQ